MLNLKKALKYIATPWALRLYRRSRSNQSLGWILSHLTPEPHLVFDVGANVGNTVHAFLEFFPDATVYAFEPCAETFGQLRTNLISDTGRVRFYQVGFSSSTRAGWLNVNSFHGANSLIAASQDYEKGHPAIQTIGREEVQLVAMDEFVREQDIKHIDLVKIDVEGFEREVLLGGRETFSLHVDTVLIEISLARHGFGSDKWIQLIQLMYDLGFDLISLYDLSYHRWAELGLRLEQMDALFAKRGKALFK